MIYYKSDFYDAKLRVDTEADTSFIKYNGEDKETELEPHTKIEADIMGANSRITEAEYNQSESGKPDDISEAE